MESTAHLQTHYQMAQRHRETDKQVGRQTRDIYVGRGQTNTEDRNKTGSGEKDDSGGFF